METAYQTKVPADMPEGLPRAAPASPADAPVAAKEAPADDAPADEPASDGEGDSGPVEHSGPVEPEGFWERCRGLLAGSIRSIGRPCPKVLGAGSRWDGFE